MRCRVVVCCFALCWRTMFSRESTRETSPCIELERQEYAVTLVFCGRLYGVRIKEQCAALGRGANLRYQVSGRRTNDRTSFFLSLTHLSHLVADRWCNSLIAWANDKGVKIYDCHTNQRITYIDRPRGTKRVLAYYLESGCDIIVSWCNRIAAA